MRETYCVVFSQTRFLAMSLNVGKMKIISFIVDRTNDGQKIDKAIQLFGADLTRRHIRRILDRGGISCNGKPVLMASKVVRKGDKIVLKWAPELSKKTVELPVFRSEDILYWQDDILAINKPPGIASVPTVSEQTPYIKKLLEPLLKAKGLDPQKLSACHRLDKETSGVLVFALSQEKADWVMSQFRLKAVKKIYYALCHRIPKKKKWELTCYLSPIDKKTGMVRVVRSGGQSSYSAFELIDSSEKYQTSLIRVAPLTGRSHQIRVHLLQSHLPIIGDKKYVIANNSLDPSISKLALKHHFLHAASLELIPAPGQAPITIEAPLPPLFVEFMRKTGLTMPK